MSVKPATWIAWGLWLLSLWLVVASILLQVSVYSSSWDVDRTLVVLSLIAFLIPASVGARIASRHPANAIGWLFLVVSLAWIGAGQFINVFTAYIFPDIPPGWSWFVWGILLMFLPSLLLSVTYLLLLFPNGKLPHRGWQPVAWMAVVLIVWISLDEALTTDLLIDTPEIDNPARMKSIDGFFRHPVVEFTGLTFAAVIFALSVMAPFLRLRRATGIARQQLKWFVLPAIVIVSIIISGMGIAFIAGDDYYQVASLVAITGLMGVAILLPAATAIAISRHNLYDIDRLINRTIVYGSLTVLLLLSFIGSVICIQFLLSPITGGNDLAVAGSTLLIAALFRPARNRLQQIVDRRFYRRKYHAQQTLQSFSVTARDAVKLDELTGGLTEIVTRTMQPEHISIWLINTTPQEEQH